MHAASTQFGRRDFFLAALLACTLIVSGSFRIDGSICGICHDDAIYVATAKSLAEGHGYRLINLPGSPPQTKYPVLFPAAMALLWSAWPQFPDNLILLQGLSLVCGGAVAGGSYLYGIRFGYFSRPVAFAAGLFCATTPIFIAFSTVTMSEMPFGLLFLLALWRTDAVLRSPDARPGFGDGLLLALPFLCRSIGIVVLPVALIAFVLARRRCGRAALGMFAGVLPWVIWSKAASPPQANDAVLNYYTDYFGWWLSFGLADPFHLISANIFRLVISVAALPFEGGFKPLFDIGGPVLSATLSAVGLLALFPAARDLTRGRMLPIALLAYFLVVLVWPWPPPRFVVPVLPLTTAYMLRSIAEVSWLPLPQRARLVACWTACCLLVGANVLLFAHYCQTRYRLGPSQPELGAAPGARLEYETMLAWLSVHTESADIIASGSDPMIALYTGRQAFYPIVCPPQALFDTGADNEEPFQGLEESLRALEVYRPRYLALMPNFHGEGYVRRWLRALIRRYPDQVIPVYRGDDPRFVIYELRYPFPDMELAVESSTPG
jgi:hypothetical protein